MSTYYLIWLCLCEADAFERHAWRLNPRSIRYGVTVQADGSAIWRA